MSIAQKISAYNRKRKWRLFCAEFAFGPDTTVLDVGFSEMEYSAVDNYLEKHYPYPENITALGIDEPVGFSRRYPRVKAVKYSGSGFPFPDKSFDVCWSNAVLEHAGSRESQLELLREICRTAKHGFLSTPNRYFPIEVHTRIPFLHWLPKGLFDRILRLVGRGWASGDYMNLLSQRELESLLSQAGFGKYTIKKNKFLFFTLDFSVIF